jgi:hypothetical protein
MQRDSHRVFFYKVQRASRLGCGVKEGGRKTIFHTVKSPTCSRGAARLQKRNMSIRAILVTIIGALLFFTIDVVFCIAIIEFSFVKSVGGKFFLPSTGRPLKRGQRAITV